MKKTLYIICIIALLLLCGSVAYYFITKANIDKQNFSIQNEKYLEQKSEACLEKFRHYYDRNNYDRSSIDSDNYGYSDIKYSPITNSCIQYFEQHVIYHDNGDYYHKYKIADETNRTNLYYCGVSTHYSDDTLANCKKGYNKKLQELGIK